MSPQTSLTEPKLDKSLTLRAVRWDDVNAVARLSHELCEALGGVASTPEDIAHEWKQEGFDPEQDAFVVETRYRHIVGYAALIDVKDHCDLSGDIYVHPQFKWLGIERTLLRAMDTRAAVHIQLAAPDLRVFSRVTDHKDEHATAIWLARNEAFRDHWNSHQLTFEKFSQYSFADAKYDPTLWVVIWKGDEVAGFSINQYRMDIGWIHILGVRPAWRAQGLGLALLYRSFGEFHQRGTKSIGLGVDASNVTGATRLYQKAGMTTLSEFVTFEKEFRAGKIL